MPIANSEIVLRYSTLAGAAGNSQPGTAAGSLGKYMSTTAMPESGLNNLFDNISGKENRDQVTDYRCVFVHNTHPTLTLLNAIVYISVDVTGGANVAIGVEGVGQPGANTHLVGSSSSQANSIANENAAPLGVTFSAPVTQEGAISLGDIGAGRCKAIWVRRQATNSGALNSDGVTLRVEGDSGA